MTALHHATAWLAMLLITAALCAPRVVLADPGDASPEAPRAAPAEGEAAPGGSSGTSSMVSETSEATSSEVEDEDERWIVAHAGIRSSVGAFWMGEGSALDSDAPVGVSFSLRLAVLLGDANLSIGPVLDVTTSIHGSDSPQTSIHTPALGVLARWAVSERIVLAPHLAYVFGDGDTSSSSGGGGLQGSGDASGTSATGLRGAQLGVGLLHRWHVVEDDTLFELGFQLTYHWLAEVDAGDPSLHGLMGGLTLEVSRLF